ncbi:MAG: hypothetical protein AAGM45_00895 [Cyanobacteria bacterium J06588_5]
MTPEQSLLYGKIARFKIDPPGVICPFSVKLAWQYQWSGPFTHRAICEYKKFIFLSMVTEQPISPATVIDRVWHQHILYTRSYWIEFCDQLLGRQIHHTPGLGGDEETHKYYVQCERAIALYKTYFGNPPTDIWTPPQLTVESLSYQWINREQYWIIPKPKLPKPKISPKIFRLRQPEKLHISQQPSSTEPAQSARAHSTHPHAQN